MSIAEHVAQLLHNLNSPQGPNFRAIVNERYDGLLPAAWRMSFGRVSPQALVGDRAFYEKLGYAFTDFETACAHIVKHDYGLAASYIGAGVDAPADIAQVYQQWESPFSVRRLDVVIGENGPVVNESDEMPGGLVHAYWLDYCYGINQARWQYALEWLTQRGPLVFAVSTTWSAPYVAEIAWLVGHLRMLGYQAVLVTETDMGSVRQKANQLFLGSMPIGTVWRQFPIFEADGSFKPFVQAAAQGTIRMVPELASWGNKAWFAAFWQHKSAFRARMNAVGFEILRHTMPSSAYFDTERSFPIGLPHQDAVTPWQMFDSLEQLCTQPTRVIATLVAKSAGAHPRASRSHGVAIGRSLTVSKWGRALDDLLRSAGPVILQRFAKPSANKLPMVNVLDGKVREELFQNYMLVRPWYIGGVLISAVAFPQEPNTVKLHGAVTGCEVPLDFG